MSCGKVASRTPGLGAQSMKVDEMKKFIVSHGTEEAKRALKAIKGAPSRDELCGIFHTFKAGRDEIRKGVGMHKLRSPSVSPISLSNNSSSSSASSRRSRSSSSSSPGTLSNAMRQMRGSMTANRLRKLKMRKAFDAFIGPLPKYRSKYRKVMQGGVPILMLKNSNYKVPRPSTNARVVGRAMSSGSSSRGSNSNRNNRMSVGSLSNRSNASRGSYASLSGGSSGNNSYGSGSGNNRGGRINDDYMIANFQNLRAKKGKYRMNNDPRLAKMSRFSKGVRIKRVVKTAGKHRVAMKTPYKMMRMPRIGGGARVPTSAAHHAAAKGLCA